MKLALSAGHNPTAKGAENQRFRISEFDLAVEINELVMEQLVGSGIEVFQVLTGTLKEKVHLVNGSSADFALETHFNASMTRMAHGFETLYFPESTDGKTLAECMLQSFHQSLPFANRGIKPRDDLYFLTGTRCPSCIIEPLFIDNDEELMYLESNTRGKEILAGAIALGIRAYATLKGDA